MENNQNKRLLLIKTVSVIFVISLVFYFFNYMFSTDMILHKKTTFLEHIPPIFFFFFIFLFPIITAIIQKGIPKNIRVPYVLGWLFALLGVITMTSQTYIDLEKISMESINRVMYWFHILVYLGIGLSIMGLIFLTISCIRWVKWKLQSLHSHHLEDELAKLNLLPPNKLNS